MAAPIVDNRNQHPYQVVFRSPTANSLLRRGQPEPLPTRFPNNHTHNNMASFRSPKLLILTLISQTEMYSCTVVYSIHGITTHCVGRALQQCISHRVIGAPVEGKVLKFAISHDKPSAMSGKLRACSQGHQPITPHHGSLTLRVLRLTWGTEQWWRQFVMMAM